MWKKYINAGSIEQVTDILSDEGNRARIIAGATDLILEMEKGVRKGIETLIDISRIPGLDRIYEDSQKQIHIGPLVTHNDCVQSKLLIEKALPLVLACWQVGSPQIRNRGTVVGNIVTASPANDTISPLMALNARIVLKNKNSSRTVEMADFYTGVRKNVLQSDEMVTEIIFPALKENERGCYIKNALRKAQAISVVNSTCILEFDNDIVKSARITLGAVATVIIHAEKAEAFISGKHLTDDVIEETARLAGEAAHPIGDVRGSASYRSYIVTVLVKQALERIKLKEKKTGLLEKPPVLNTKASSHTRKEITTEITAETPITTTINGKKYILQNGQHKTLLRLLREEAGLIGTKEGCAEGECGACTIHLDGAAVMACMVPAPRADGAEIVTIEGMSKEDELHPVQQAFIEEGAVQCGYCTPGFIMSSVKFLEENKNPSEIEIKHALTGNLCRCTGYYKIIRAVEKAAEKMQAI
ncbi:FAD binding domain-containing protein [Leptolinea tardivitalis]|uniref:FAD binding domain-containing protein n=1 Tax=Leptolinea tardivitalis TaxID=229920 RepID=UPI0009D71FE7|nr:FAD binding domain-containing protein [Leptolinea tardivitalis]GAP22965.1 aerobic-type carbon monoxide dehydrogenase, small subunit CoxS/CutS homolog [Leptolinea tardivitalis]